MNALSPKPKQSKSDNWLRQFWRNHQAVATIIAAFMGAIVVIAAGAAFRPIVNVFTGPPASPTPPVTSVPAPSPPPSPTTATPPEPTAAVTVRRTTGDHPLILSADYVADLDSRDADWGVQGAYQDVIKPDIHLTSLSLRGEIAVVSGSDEYETCQYATGYKGDYQTDEFEAGTHLCVRTTEERLAFVTIEKIVGKGSSTQLRLNVKVWERP
jgi:hypothetical protein